MPTALEESEDISCGGGKCQKMKKKRDICFTTDWWFENHFGAFYRLQLIQDRMESYSTRHLASEGDG